MIPAPRIRWETTQYGGFTGHVGSLEPWTFQIWQVDGPDSPWRLDSALLGQFGFHVDHPDPEALKPHAERWLSGFVSSLGAVFPEDGSDCPAVTRLEVIDHTTGSKHLISYLPDVPRAFVAYGIKAETSFQDGGRTLKVFLTDPQTPPDTAVTAGEE